MVLVVEDTYFSKMRGNAERGRKKEKEKKKRRRMKTPSRQTGKVGLPCVRGEKRGEEPRRRSRSCGGVVDEGTARAEGGVEGFGFQLLGVLFPMVRFSSILQVPRGGRIRLWALLACLGSTTKTGIRLGAAAPANSVTSLLLGTRWGLRIGRWRQPSA